MGEEVASPGDGVDLAVVEGHVVIALAFPRAGRPRRRGSRPAARHHVVGVVVTVADPRDDEAAATADDHLADVEVGGGGSRGCWRRRRAGSPQWQWPGRRTTSPVRGFLR